MIVLLIVAGWLVLLVLAVGVLHLTSAPQARQIERLTTLARLEALWRLDAHEPNRRGIA